MRRSTVAARPPTRHSADSAGHGDFDTLAVVVGGSGGQACDFVEIEAHGEQEVDEGEDGEGREA